MVKRPKPSCAIRVCCCLLGIKTMDDLLSHPMMGRSWEGFVLKHISHLSPRSAEVIFYRTAAGAEIDAVVQHG